MDIDSRSNTTMVDRRAPVASAPPAQRPTWAQIDLSVITANARVLAACADGAELMAVVKADAYGHGMVPVARAARAGGATWFAVALVEEGVALRDAGLGEPTLVLTEPPIGAVGAMLDAGLTPTVYTPSFATAIEAEAATRVLDSVDVHLQLDTGMRRVGVPEHDVESVARHLATLDRVHVTGLWSHFACADEPDHPSVERQSASFARGLQTVKAQGLTPSLVHLCNSAGTLTRPQDHYDLVRCGIALYGLDPGNGVVGDTPVCPALRWVSHVSYVKRLAAGEAISYGHTWTAPHDTTVATVPVGYADGVNRTLSGVGEVVIGGRRCPMVGRVTMDQVLVDVGDDHVAIDDEVVLLGRQGSSEVTADDWAQWLGTINYEVVTTVGTRVPRVYTQGTP